MELLTTNSKLHHAIQPTTLKVCGDKLLGKRNNSSLLTVKQVSFSIYTGCRFHTSMKTLQVFLDLLLKYGQNMEFKF